MIAIKNAQDFTDQVGNLTNNIFAAILDEIPDYIYIKDINSNIVYSNKAHLEVIGSTRDGVIGKSDYDFFPEALAHMYFKDESEMFESGVPVIKIEQTQNQSREYIWLSTIKVPIVNSEGFPIGLIGISRRIYNPMSTEIVDDFKKQIQAVIDRAYNEGVNLGDLQALQGDVFGMLDMITSKFQNLSASSGGASNALKDTIRIKPPDRRILES